MGDFSLIPKRISNIRRRKGESDEDWAKRYWVKKEQVEERERQKEIAKREEKRRKALLARDPSTLLRLREFAQLSDDTIQDLALPVAIQVPSEWPPENGRLRDTLSTDHNLEGLRMNMALWVEDTWRRKISEASCNLFCFGCPSAQLLNCAAQNFTAAAKDGHHLPIKEL